MAKFKVGDIVKSAGMRDVYVVKRIMRVGDFSFDPNLKAEAEKAYAKGDVGYEVYDKDDDDEVTYLFEKDDRLTLANAAPLSSANAVVQNAINARRARNAGDLSALFQAALSAVRKLAEEAKKINPDHEVYKDAVKAGTALLRVKPKW